jgi:hypothetical protein
MPTEAHMSSEPTDRLTRLCAAMTDALESHPERGDEKCIVFLQDGSIGGLQLHGYEDAHEAIIDLFLHLKALFQSQGKDLGFMAFGGEPESN